MTVTALLCVPCDLCLESVLLLNVCAEQICFSSTVVVSARANFVPCIIAGDVLLYR